MKKFVAVFCLSTAVFAPSVAKAFTLYTPAVSTAANMTCSIVNVGNIILQVQVIPYHLADPLPGAEVWLDLAQREIHEVGASNYDRCEFKVRAKNPRQTATRRMVRAGARFDSAYSFEAW